jgi:hypothetical protein
MSRPTTQPQACLSYLVGPGPRSARATAELRVGLSNLDQQVHAGRLRVSVHPCQPAGPPLVEAEWGGLLPRRREREVALVLDWDRAELRVDGVATPFRFAATAGGLHVVRAELHDGRDRAPSHLEVGVRSPAPAPAP